MFILESLLVLARRWLAWLWGRFERQ